MEQLFVILLLIMVSAFFSLAEISFAAARKIKLSALSAEGDKCATYIWQLQEDSENFFTAI